MASFFDALGDIGVQIARGLRDQVIERGWFGDTVVGSQSEASPMEPLGWSLPNEPASPADSGWFTRQFSARPAHDGALPDRITQNHDQDHSIER